MNYYEHHLGDWAKKCGSLSVMEEGAYRRLLDLYYINEGPFPADLKQIFKDARAHKKTEKDAILFALRKFFVLSDCGYSNSRADEEIARFRSKSQKAKDSANARWQRENGSQGAQQAEIPTDANAHANASDENMRTHSEGNAPRARPQSPVTSNQTPEKKGRAQAPSRPDGVTEQVWVDWLQHRKSKRAPVTATVLREAQREADKAGLPLDRFFAIWCARGSQGLQADWIKPHERGPAPHPPEPTWRTEQRNRMQQAAPYAVAKRPPTAVNPDHEATDVLPRS